MPICPTRADGMSWAIPSTIPRPARRIGTSASFFPATRVPRIDSSGVSTSTGSSGRSFVTSYAMSIAISLTSCLKSRVVVCLSRRIVSLCWIRGCSSTVRLGKWGCGMAEKVRHAARRCHVAGLRPETRFEGLTVGRRRAIVAHDQVQWLVPHVSYLGEVAPLPGVHPVHERGDEGTAAVALPQLPEDQRHLLRHRCRVRVPARLGVAPAEVVD